MSLLSAAAADLYSADPENFTARRKELAAQARRAGDAEAAKSIAALGKPTKSAWLVNKLVRTTRRSPSGSPSSAISCGRRGRPRRCQHQETVPGPARAH